MWYWLVQYLADVEVEIVCVDFRHGCCLDARDDGSETNVFTPFSDDQRSCEMTIAGSRKRAKRRAVAPMRQLSWVHSLVRGSSGQKHCSAGFVQSVGDSIFGDETGACTEPVAGVDRRRHIVGTFETIKRARNSN